MVGRPGFLAKEKKKGVEIYLIFLKKANAIPLHAEVTFARVT
jgi:hypothetical protein